MVGLFSHSSASVAHANSALIAFRRILAAPSMSDRSSLILRTCRGIISATGLSACFSQMLSSARRRHACVLGSRRLKVGLLQYVTQRCRNDPGLAWLAWRGAVT